MNATGPYWWSVNIGSGNGLVPSGSVDQDLQRHMASLGPNELKLDSEYDILSKMKLETNVKCLSTKSGQNRKCEVVRRWRRLFPLLRAIINLLGVKLNNHAGQIV